MNATYRINQWFARLEQPGERMKREDLCFLMVQARHLIERADAPDHYRAAGFYADWVVHTALDRSVVSFEMLRDITSLLVSNLNPTSPQLTREISRLIGLPRLRAELIRLFSENRLPTVVFDYYDNWKGFVSFLLWFIAGQPIRFPTKLTGPALRIRNDVSATERPYNLAVEALTIVDHNGAYHWGLQTSGDKPVTIMGQVELAEGQDLFAKPPSSDNGTAMAGAV